MPAYSLNELADVKRLTPEDLAGGVFLTANIWQGTYTAGVSVSLNGGPAMAMNRTREAGGEAPLIGAENSDPYAAMRQLSVSRTALESRSGNAAAQGHVGGRRVAAGPQPPQPAGPVADRSSHLWRFRLPVDLAPGVYTAQIVADHHERVLTEGIIFDAVTERPQADWRSDAWSAFVNGPPVR